jgi:SAM-dependent methyltransferase
MSEWNSGYVADVDYTFGYYGELNPVRLRLPFIMAGIMPPNVGMACELGFGQGLSINFHAAASAVQWFGTDFNAAHAGFAQAMAEVSGSGARLMDEAFAAFCTRDNMPDFDFIGLHGIWSWISDENRREILDFLGRKLKVGGVLYISYNTLPGWSGFAPMRHLLASHAASAALPGSGTMGGVAGAIDFAEKLLALNPRYAASYPQLKTRFNKLKALNPNYVAHEYFNRHWQPTYFSEMERPLSEAKLTFAGSAHHLDHIRGLNLTEEQYAFLDSIPDPVFRQTVYDFIINQQFRRDYWVRGIRRLTPQERIRLARAERVVLTTHRPDVPLKARGVRVEGNLSESFYKPILDLLADHKPRTLGQIEQELGGDLGTTAVLEAVMVLCGAGHLASTQDDAAVAEVKHKTDMLNTWLLHRAAERGDIAYLASPLIGGGVVVNRIEQLFLVALQQGRLHSSDQIQFAWSVLSSMQQKLVKDGKALETERENLAELSAIAENFNVKRLPILKALLVAGTTVLDNAS